MENIFINQQSSFARSLQFESVVIFAIILIFFTYYFKHTYPFVIILLVFAYYISSSYINIKNDISNDFNKETMFKLQTLQNTTFIYLQYKEKLTSNSNKINSNDIVKLYKSNKLDSLYIDANMISFLHSIIVLNDYNPELFYTLLKGTNNILKIKNQIDTFYNANGVYPENTSHMFETALQLRQNSINNIHNFIYTIPKVEKMTVYLNSVIDRYQVLVSRITDNLFDSYTKNLKSREMNNTIKYVSYNTTKAYDNLSTQFYI